MRAVALLLPTYLLAGCANSRPERMSLAEALADFGPPLLPSRPETPAAAPAARPEAHASLELRAALLRFGTRARAHRAQVPRGGAMPAPQGENWEEMLALLDHFLHRAAAQTHPLDAVRARVSLDAELELDAQAYGDFPPLLAEEVVERLGKLTVRMAAIRRLGVKPAPERPSFTWPLEPTRVTSLFGRRIDPLDRSWRTHQGVDLAAEPGQVVTAAAPGTITFAAWNGGHGQQVEIEHPGGILTRYSHLSQLLVQVGFAVERGAPLGLAGSTGKSTGVHLHFELIRDGEPVDPLEELDAPPTSEPVAAR